MKFTQNFHHLSPSDHFFHPTFFHPHRQRAPATAYVANRGAEMSVDSKFATERCASIAEDCFALGGNHPAIHGNYG
jgi:hypothetical protein